MSRFEGLFRTKIGKKTLIEVKPLILDFDIFWADNDCVHKFFPFGIIFGQNAAVKLGRDRLAGRDRIFGRIKSATDNFSNEQNPVTGDSFDLALIEFGQTRLASFDRNPLGGWVDLAKNLVGGGVGNKGDRNIFKGAVDINLLNLGQFH